MTETQIFENTNSGIPPAEFTVNEMVVKQLLDEEYPQFANYEICEIGAGWDNVVYRIGERHTIRMPRHKSGNGLLQNEQKWLSMLAPKLNLPIPAPIYIGKPSQYFPFTWSINPYFSGDCVGEAELDENQASIFAQFLSQLKIIDPHGAPENPVRGVALSERSDVMNSRMQSVAKERSDLMARARRVWQQALAAPIDTKPVWLHGDLHNFNIIAKNKEIAAIIDWGDMCAGDCATDLSAIFTLFQSPNIQRQIFQQLRATDATILRTKGWALMMGVLFMDWGKNNQNDRYRIGKKIIERVLAFK